MLGPVDLLVPVVLLGVAHPRKQPRHREVGTLDRPIDPGLPRVARHAAQAQQGVDALDRTQRELLGVVGRNDLAGPVLAQDDLEPLVRQRYRGV